MFTFIVYHKLSVVEVVLGLIRGIWSKVLGFSIISSQEHNIFMHGFLLVELVTLKKLVRASVQVFSGRTTKPVWFLKLGHPPCTIVFGVHAT
jgi:multisubunit Na+/H+ antiporter MnhE subunit